MDVDLQSLPAQVFLVLDQADKNAPGLREQVYIALPSRHRGGASYIGRRPSSLRRSGSKGRGSWTRPPSMRPMLPGRLSMPSDSKRRSRAASSSSATASTSPSGCAKEHSELETHSTGHCWTRRLWISGVCMGLLCTSSTTRSGAASLTSHARPRQRIDRPVLVMMAGVPHLRPYLRTGSR